MKHWIAFLGLLWVLPAMAAAPIESQELSYKAGDETLRGYVAHPKNVDGKVPGVLVVHEWWGHNDYARKRADMLARMGYAALALDMYGDGKTADHPKQAGEFSGSVKKNWERGKARFTAARRALVDNAPADDSKIAAIGYCFGGFVVLQMAREGAPLAGVASFHGSLATDRPAEQGAVKADMLVLHGAEDRFVPPEHVAAFMQEMNDAGADYKLVVYPNATHGFTNPGADAKGKQFNIPLAYNARADEQSWQQLEMFLGRVFE